MNLVKQVIKWLEERKIFSRKRKSNKQRALGVLLYYAGLIYEKAVWNGTVRDINYEEEKKTDSSRRERNNDKRNIWGAVDLDDDKILAGWVSFWKKWFGSKAFLKKVRSTCKGRF